MSVKRIRKQTSRPILFMHALPWKQNKNNNNMNKWKGLLLTRNLDTPVNLETSAIAIIERANV